MYTATREQTWNGGHRFQIGGRVPLDPPLARILCMIPRNIEKSVSDILICIRLPFLSSLWISVSGCKLAIIPDIQPANQIAIISGAARSARLCGEAWNAAGNTANDLNDISLLQSGICVGLWLREIGFLILVILKSVESWQGELLTEIWKHSGFLFL